jgi:aldehyde dehydrogenase (NAD+)
LSEISLVINNQRKYFQSGILRSVDFRKKQLKLLKQALVKNYQGIVSALKADINKSEEEAYISEYTIVMNELDCALKHISK